MFRAAIRPSRQRSTVRYVRSSQADLDICTGRSCLRTQVSGSWHRSFHCWISFWFHVKFFLQSLPTTVIVIRSGTCACIFGRSRDGHAFWDGNLRFRSFSSYYDSGKEIRCRLFIDLLISLPNSSPRPPVNLEDYQSKQPD